MGLLLANGHKVLSATISFPLVGAWVADLVVDNPDGIVGACEIVCDGGVTLKGTGARTGVWMEATHIRVAPGAAGLGKAARAQRYRPTNVQTVLADLLRAAGETLSSTADAAILGKTLPAYTLMAAPVGRAIAALLGDPRTAGASWRMLPDGTLWVGAETWPDSGLADPADVQALADAPELGREDLGIETVSLLPGTTLGGRKVGYVEYTIGDGSVRARALFES